MRAPGRTGVVPLDALIGTDGTVVFARVVSASVHPDFADAAVEAVRQWKFSPTLLQRQAGRSSDDGDDQLQPGGVGAKPSHLTAEAGSPTVSFASATPSRSPVKHFVAS
jgi:TonB family protein